MIVLPAIWLLVIGYGLLYVGYRNQSGHPTSFAEAFFGQKSSTGGGGQVDDGSIQATGSSSGFTAGAGAGKGGGGGGGGSW